MIIKSTKAGVGLSANITSDQPNIDGDFVLGLTSKSLSLGAGKAYTFRADVPAGYSFDFFPATGMAMAAWGGSPPYTRSQAVGVGNVAASGNVDFIVGGFNMEISVGLTIGQTPEQWLDVIVDVMNVLIANPDPIYNYGIIGFRFRRVANVLIFEPDPNSSTPGTITTAHTLTIFNNQEESIALAQTQFIGGGSYLIADGNDFDGNPLGTISPLAMHIETTNPISVRFNQGEGTPTFSLSDNGVLLQCYTSIPNQVTISAPTGSEVNVTIIGN